MLMADLRGFTALSERLDPKEVVTLLNRYLSSMVAIIKKYGGTIEQYIGDATFVLFGAPVWKEDDAQRAVACAVEMQLAMAPINEENAREGLPEIEMGDRAAHRTGRCGQYRRTRTDAVWGDRKPRQSHPAHSSLHVGGRILISETTRREVGGILRLGRHMEVKVKGVEQAIAARRGARHWRLAQAVTFALARRACSFEVPRSCSLLDRRGWPGRRRGDQRRADETVFETRGASAGQDGPRSCGPQDADRWRPREGNPGAGLLQGGSCAGWKRRSAVRSIYVATSQIRGFAAGPRCAGCGQFSLRAARGSRPSAISLRDWPAAKWPLRRNLRLQPKSAYGAFRPFIGLILKGS